VARSVLIQSYAPKPLAAWQQRCVDSVRRWTREAGWEYRYVDDRLLEVVPAWYRERCGTLKLPVTDFGRLLLLREALAEPGCEEALWIDADVLVMAPLQPRVPEGCAFTREVWIWRDAGGQVRTRAAIANALVYMRRGAPELDKYIEAIQHLVANTPADRLQHHSASTLLLTVISQREPLAVIPGAGMLSPQLTVELARGGGELTRHYAGLLPEPLACANLCGSLIGKKVWDAVLDEATVERAMDALLAGALRG
jgi:hypothetical protein